MSVINEINRKTGDINYLAMHDSTVIVSDSVIMSKGSIINNPFRNNKLHNITVTWLVQNRELVLKHIRRILLSKHIRGTDNDVEEVYGRAIDYFSEPKREFQNDYFGEKEAKEYTIAQYCISNMHYVVMVYIKDLTTTDMNAMPLINTDEFDSGLGVIESSILTGETLEEMEEVSDLVNDEDFIIYNSIYDTLDSHKVYYNQSYYQDFDVKRFIHLMYLDVKYNDVDKQKGYTAEMLRVSKKLVDLLVDELAENVIRKNEHALDLYEDITALVLAKNEGWKLPPLV